MKLLRWWSWADNRSWAFQFLWGWNVYEFTQFKRLVEYVKLSIPLRMKLLSTCPHCGQRLLTAFNSFEDETWWNRVWNIRMPHNIFQFLWGWNKVTADSWYQKHKLSIPLRMKRSIVNVAYFAPGIHFQFLWGWNVTKLPLTPTLKQWAFNSFEDETWSLRLVLKTEVSFFFQFLWGWNLQVGDKSGQYCQRRFQFLWGWNFLVTVTLTTTGL